MKIFIDTANIRRSRRLMHVVESAKAGAHVATIPWGY